MSNQAKKLALCTSQSLAEVPKDGMNSLSKLHLHKPGLKLLRSNGIFNLRDLEKVSEQELATKIGFGYERTDFIAERMEQLGRPLKLS